MGLPGVAADAFDDLVSRGFASSGFQILKSVPHVLTLDVSASTAADTKSFTLLKTLRMGIPASML